jgi:hypothetical protein
MQKRSLGDVSQLSLSSDITAYSNISISSRCFEVIPLEPGERVQENPGESVSCQSGVKRSELNATRIFQASERTRRAGSVGCLFFGDFLFAQKESHI